MYLLARPGQIRQPLVGYDSSARFGRPELLWSGASPSIDITRKRLSSVSSSLSLVTAAIGKSVRFTPNTTNAITFAGGITSARTAATFVSVFDWTGGGSDNFSQLLGLSTTNDSFRVGLNSWTTTTADLCMVKGGVAALNTVSISSGQAYVLVTSHRQDTGEYYILVRPIGGGAILRNTQVSTAASSAGNGTYGVGIARTDYAGAWNGNISLAYASFDFLPEVLARQLLYNPWQLFAPPARRLWALSSSGISGSFSTTLTSATSTGSGTTTVLGSASNSLNSVGLNSAGTTTVLANFATSLGLTSLTASGSIGSAVSGTFSTFLGNSSLSGAGNVTNVGTFSNQLNSATLTSAGTPAITGVGSITINSATLNAFGISGTPSLVGNWRTLTNVGP